MPAPARRKRESDAQYATIGELLATYDPWTAPIDEYVQYARRYPDELQKPQLVGSQAKRLRLGSAHEGFHTDEIAKRDNHICHVCYTHVDRHELSLDHVVPITLGGDHTRANSRIAHRDCNWARGSGPQAVDIRSLLPGPPQPPTRATKENNT